MREILFRGKTLECGKWVYGDLNKHSEGLYPYITDAQGTKHYVRKETVGQFTGFRDENGVRIFEGDRVRCTDGEGKVTEKDTNTGEGVVEWLNWGLWYISNIENGLGDIKSRGFIEVLDDTEETGCKQWK